MFAILPFIEESAVHDMGKGSPGWPVPAKKKIELSKIIQTPVQIFYCPSRRRAQAYPVKIWTGKNWTHDGSPLARNDYAVNVGSGSTIAGLVGAYTPNTYIDAPTWNWPDQKLYDGISFIRSEIALRQVADGTSKTYMAGEKALNVDAYEANDGVTIIDHGDDQGYLVGHNGDTVRSSGFPIIQDIRGGNPYESFGSPHPGGMNMMFADGSVRTVNFDISLDVHKGMGTRAGGETATEN
jgi:prepilin-type processing-associated H-X9-DG protein